jgi:hypothetical protein
MDQLFKERTDLRVSVFTDLDGLHKLSPNIVAMLRQLYASPDQVLRLLGTILNHCFTARTDSVLISRDMLDMAVRADPNVSRAYSVHTALYKAFTAYVEDGAVLMQMQASTKRGKGQQGLCAVYELSEALQLMLSLSTEEKARVKAALSRVKKPINVPQSGVQAISPKDELWGRQEYGRRTIFRPKQR